MDKLTVVLMSIKLNCSEFIASHKRGLYKYSVLNSMYRSWLLRGFT